MPINVSSLLCYKLFFLVRTNEHFIDKRMKQFDLSRSQWKALIRFNFLPNPCTQQQLLKSLEIDRAHLTRILDQLEQRKLIIRTRQINDKRNFIIALTTSGKSVLQKMIEIMQCDSNELVAGFSAHEVNIFEKLLHKATENALIQLAEKNN
jgi:MarR family transcriptional regulator for hemolysin